MQKQEREEPSVVFAANTLVEPNAMMIKFLNAAVAYCAVFRPGRLVDLASRTLILLFEHHFIVFVQLGGLPRLYLVLYPSRIHRAGLVETVVAGEHDRTCYPAMIASQVGTWAVLDIRSCYVDIVASHGDE